MIQTINFMLTGQDRMHCAGCEQRISRVLRLIPGIQKVQTSIPGQRITVTFNSSQFNSEQVREKLEEIGYEATPQEGGSP